MRQRFGEPGGVATLDLLEIMSADISDNLNIVVETGGANKWATDYMDPSLNQWWQVISEDLVHLESIKAKNMSEGSTLSDFISYSAENFPADRYMLVLWDHGGGTGNPLGGDGFDLSHWLSLSWADEDQWTDLSGFFADNSYDDSELYIEEKGDEYVLSLSDEDWELIAAIEQRVFLDDGEGFIDLGFNSMYQFDENGDLIITFDNTWVALDGQLVCFYNTDYVVEDDGYWYNYGVVPILYEDEEAELVLAW